MRSIKVLDHAMSTSDGLSNCERFVEIFGLKSLFSAFMRKVNMDTLGTFKYQMSLVWRIYSILLVSLRPFINHCPR